METLTVLESNNNVNLSCYHGKSILSISNTEQIRIATDMTDDVVSQCLVLGSLSQSRFANLHHIVKFEKIPENS